MDPERRDALGEILASIALLSRQLRAGGSAPFGDSALSPSQYEALFHVSHARGGLTPGALASAMAVSRGAITQIVDTLREADLIEDSPHPSDGRSRVLRLTSAARAEIGAFEAEVIDRVAEQFIPLGTAELQTLARLLERVERPIT